MWSRPVPSWVRAGLGPNKHAKSQLLMARLPDLALKGAQAACTPVSPSVRWADKFPMFSYAMEPIKGHIQKAPGEGTHMCAGTLVT